MHFLQYPTQSGRYIQLNHSTKLQVIYSHILLQSMFKMSDDMNYEPNVEEQSTEYRSDDSYPVPVVNDAGESGVNPNTEDSDEQLARDDADAIDESNIIEERTRNAKPQGTYTEPGDEEGLPGPEDGTSRIRTG